MLIPARRLSHWAAIPGTETTYAGVVPVVANRHILETAAATVVMAYPTSPRTDPQPRGIRLDFGWVVQLAFTSFWRSDPAEVAGIDTPDRIFALNVLDNSPLVDQFLSGYSATEWPFDHPPKEVIRHYHVSFDDFGSYNVLAVDCAARAFSWSPSKQPPWNPGASPLQRAVEQANEEANVLSAAMSLDPLPPIMNDPFRDASGGSSGQ